MKKSIWSKIVIFTIVLVFSATLSFAADPKAPAKPTPPVKPAVAEPAKVELIDINTATKEQLMAISGIGEAYAQKIIDGRPYAKKDLLKSKKIISGTTYDKIKDKIIAKQAPKKK